MLGKFQMENAKLAVLAYEEICKKNEHKIDREAVRAALKDTFLPARLEVVSEKPLIVLDGAQNAESMQRVKESIEKIFDYDRLIVILGVCADKDSKGISKVLKGFANEFVLTGFNSKRALDPHMLRGFFKYEKAVVAEDPAMALGLAFKSAKKRDLILVTGSFYLAGEIRKALNLNAQM